MQDTVVEVEMQLMCVVELVSIHDWLLQEEVEELELLNVRLQIVKQPTTIPLLVVQVAEPLEVRARLVYALSCLRLSHQLAEVLSLQEV